MSAALQRGRRLAEDAAERLRLRALPGALVAVGQVAEGEVFVGRVVVVNAEGGPVDMGVACLPWAAIYGALSYGVSGWVGFKVGARSRVMAPTVDEMRQIRYGLTQVGWDWSCAPFEQEERERGR